MKKLLQVFFFFLTALLFMLPLTVSAQCGLYYEGFESGTTVPANIISSGGSFTRTIQTSGSAVGNNHLQQTGNGSHFDGAYIKWQAGTPDYISFRLRTATANAHNAYFVIGDSAAPNSFGTIWIYITSSNQLRFYANASNDYTMNASMNTWYHIELKNINFSTFTYDIWVDGSLKYTGMPFRNNTSYIDRAYIYAISSSTDSYDEIIIGGSPVNPNISITDPTCPGDSNASAMAAPTNGTPPYSYAWSTGDTSAGISNLPAGTYALTITDSNGCARTDSLTITGPAAFSSSYGATPTTCPDGNDGFVNYILMGGTGPYTYSWSSGDTTKDVLNATKGTHYLTATDSNGCVFTDSAIVPGPADWVVNYTQMIPTCPGDNDGGLTANVVGATPGYSYSWSTGDTSQSITGQAAGSFVFTATDSIGCVYSDTVLLADRLPISSNAFITADSGGMTGAIDLTPTGGTSPYTFMWSDSSSSTTEDLSGLAAGTYSVIITDSNGCVFNDTFVVGTYVGMGGQLNGPEISIFPNPTSGMMNISASGFYGTEVKISLFDLSGKLLTESKTGLITELKHQVDLSDYTQGIFILEVSGENWRQMKRVIKR